MRDELCKNGELLSSPALRYTEKELQTSLEMLRVEKLPKENYDDENDKEQELSRAEKVSTKILRIAFPYFFHNFKYSLFAIHTFLFRDIEVV